MMSFSSSSSNSRFWLQLAGAAALAAGTLLAASRWIGLDSKGSHKDSPRRSNPSSSPSPSSTSNTSATYSQVDDQEEQELRTRRPTVSLKEVRRLLKARYNIHEKKSVQNAYLPNNIVGCEDGAAEVLVLIAIKELPSYDDLNFRIDVQRIQLNASQDHKSPAQKVVGEVESLVLKFNLSDRGGADLRLENAAMNHLRTSREDPDLASFIPRIISASGNCEMFTYQSNGQDSKLYHVRLLTFIPGMMLADVPMSQRSGMLMSNLGRLLGRCDAAFSNCNLAREHIRTARSRDLLWDLRNASRLSSWVSCVPDQGKRRLLGLAFGKFKDGTTQFLKDPSAGGLRAQIVHNDANDYNIVVTKTSSPMGNDAYQLSGLIDFGDIVHTTLINNLAIALAYCCCDTSTSKSPLCSAHVNLPLQIQADFAHKTAFHLVKGYNAVMPLKEQEIDVLWWLMIGRICQSLASSAKRSDGEPDNEYLRVSEAPFWRLLEAISAKNFQEHASLARENFRAACGFLDSR